MSMLVEDTPLNIIDLLAKHGQDNLSVDHTYIHEVKELTRGQSANLMWQYQRKGRLTASNFYSAFHYRSTSTDNYIVKNIMGKYQFTSKSVEYGKSQEPVKEESTSSTWRVVVLHFIVPRQASLFTRTFLTLQLLLMVLPNVNVVEKDFWK